MTRFPKDSAGPLCRTRQRDAERCNPRATGFAIVRHALCAARSTSACACRSPRDGALNTPRSSVPYPQAFPWAEPAQASIRPHVAMTTFFIVPSDATLRELDNTRQGPPSWWPLLLCMIRGE